MADIDPQKIWDDYYDRIKRRRMSAAAILWAEIEAAGATGETIFALDFAHFGPNREEAERLTLQLSENYAMEVPARDERDFWHVKGTTRPKGVCLTKEEHLEWVEFMADVASSYACVFSEWALEAPAIGKVFRSVHLDDD